ncbi:MAG: virA [Gemmataceae bacterium]|nr:virA [Gemmataceae bacterium]
MSSPGSLSHALGFLPNWWQETTDPTALDTLLAGWVRAGGWRAGGFVWPADGAPAVVKAAPAGVVSDSVVPPEVPEVVRQLRAGEPVVVVAVAGGATRVYAPVTFPGRPAGLIWAERPAGQPWAGTDHELVAVTGRAVERSPAAAAAIGPVIDPDRLGQRLADAAVIARRMAHDFDNILTGILGFSDLSIPMLPVGSQQASFVAEITKAVHRGIAFTQQLHQLSRGGEARPTPGSVVATLTREETRLKPAMHPTLRVEKDLSPSLPAVAVDAGLLQTALGHLFENAVQACPQGGTVRVSARPVDLTAADARAFLGKAEAGPHLLVTITDSGPGIKPEVRRRLFAEPFYTTKVKHRGLGLAVVYRVVSVHRGGIQIDPVPPPGTGTQVRVVLPLAAGRPSVSTPTPPPAHPGGLSADAVRVPGSSNTTTIRG